MKRSQISIFLIIIISILIIAFLVFRTNSRFDPSPIDNLDRESEIFSSYMQQCFSDFTKDIIFNRLSLQGGRIDINSLPYRKSGYINVPYWYFNNTDFSPSIESMQKELAKMLEDKSKSCANLAGEGVLQTINISKEEGKIAVTINPENIIIELNNGFEIYNERDSRNIDRIYAEVSSPFGKDFALIKSIFEQMKSQPKGFDYSDLCKDRSNIIDILKHNDMIILHDFETYFSSDYERTLIIQFAVEGLNAYGEC